MRSLHPVLEKEIKYNVVKKILATTLLRFQGVSN